MKRVFKITGLIAVFLLLGIQSAVSCFATEPADMIDLSDGDVLITDDAVIQGSATFDATNPVTISGQGGSVIARNYSGTIILHNAQLWQGLHLTDSSNVTVTLKGENQIRSEQGAALEVTGGNSVTINGNGSLTATGGTDGAGIGGTGQLGSGNISISDSATVTAFAEGSRFAIDTYDVSSGMVKPVQGARILQGTFMKGSQYAGQAVSIYKDVIPDSGIDLFYSDKICTAQLPAGYRSFAVTVEKNSNYLIQAGDEWFSKDVTDAREDSVVETGEHTAHFATDSQNVSDHFWLYVREVYAELIVPDDTDPTTTTTTTTTTITTTTTKIINKNHSATVSTAEESQNQNRQTAGRVAVRPSVVPEKITPSKNADKTRTIIEENPVPLTNKVQDKEADSSFPVVACVLIGAALTVAVILLVRKRIH